MPIYEFYSADTHKIYSFFSRKVRNPEEIPFCPDGKKFKMEKLISGFSITGKQVSDTAEQTEVDNSDPLAGLEPGKADLLMKEMEKSIDGMDDENPDPKQMGSLIRKMSEMTGESIDEQMEEVVRKLEEGKDPNDIEQEMEDLMDESKESVEGNSAGNESTRRNKHSRIPSRDSMLYEFEDYMLSS